MRPSLLEGLLFAAGASVLGALLFHLLATTLGVGWAIRAVAAMLALGYGFYLYARTNRRTGRALFIVLWLAASAFLVANGAPLYAVCGTYLGGVWLLRSALFHSRAIAVLVDLVLVVVGALATVWAWRQTGSVVAALWCLLLAQSLFVLLPGSVTQASGDEESQAFARAERAAAAALRRLNV
jgi:hypothetical protein